MNENRSDVLNESGQPLRIKVRDVPVLVLALGALCAALRLRSRRPEA